MEKNGRLKIERIGGLGGFGAPNSHLKSQGEMSMSELAPEDAQAVDALFSGEALPGSTPADGFRYRITKTIGDSEQSTEVPEEIVPDSIKNSVKDTLI